MEHFETTIEKVQGDFRSECSRIEFRSPVHQVIGLEKAFESVNGECIPNDLRSMDTSREYLKLYSVTCCIEK